MSKSLGNVLDPLEIIEEYGADALRFSLIINSGQDISISKEKFEIGRNFANKIWNASRLIFMNTDGMDANIDLEKIANDKDTSLHNKWIISKFYSMLENINSSIEQFRFSEAESYLYEFFWNNFCDWYLERIKSEWNDPTVKEITITVLEKTLRVMHPFMPYVTEEVWGHIHPEQKGSLGLQRWPVSNQELINHSAESDMSFLVLIITQIRNLRAQWNINPKESVSCHLSTSSKTESKILEQNSATLIILAKISNLQLSKSAPALKNSAIAVIGKTQIAVPIGDLVDVEKEKMKISAQIDQIKNSTSNLSKRLKNKEFLKKAPEEIVEKEKARLTQMDHKLKELQTVITNLQ